jgi:hypothetical protein
MRPFANSNYYFFPLKFGPSVSVPTSARHAIPHLFRQAAIFANILNLYGKCANPKFYWQVNAFSTFCDGKVAKKLSFGWRPKRSTA